MTAEKTVTIIPAAAKDDVQNRRTHKLRVAAYCRVSTDQEEQITSYEAQKSHYTDKIMGNPEWEFAGIFADEGISGVNAKKRPEFIRLMNLCKKGRIDIILTKSISRFSRNTLDCISYIRMLKERKVTVIFEKEGINTMQMASEMAISFLGSFAQAESESLSKNVAWGKRESYKKGKVTFQYSRILGYEKGEDGNPVIVEEQAAIVRRIYEQYLRGDSIHTIRNSLMADGIPSTTGKENWAAHTIQYMLQNERYVGDAILQKTYTPDFLTKKTVVNSGEMPMYHVKNNHPPIISREIWELTQQEIARRAGKRKVADKSVKTENGKYSSKYALTELLTCGDCGTQYRRVTWTSNGQKRIVWRCINRLEYGKKYCKCSETVFEQQLQDAVMGAINLILDHKDDFVTTLKNNILIALDVNDSDIDIAAVSKRIELLNAEMVELVKTSVANRTEIGTLDSRFKEISDEIKTLQALITAAELRHKNAGNESTRIKEIMEILDADTLRLEQYDDRLVRKMIEHIKVLHDGQLIVKFKGGFEICQTMQVA